MFVSDPNSMDGLVEQAVELSRKSDFEGLRELLKNVVRSVIADDNYANALLEQ